MVARPEFYRCYLNADWEETGLARVTFIWETEKRKVTIALFLVDLFCLGVKNVMTDSARSLKTFELFLLPLYYFDGTP